MVRLMQSTVPRLVLAPCRSASSQRTRLFHSCSACLSGHNRWSKIKHDKAKEDASKNKQRSVFAHAIAHASRMHGPDPNSNPRLADVVSKAKKAGFAKHSIEAAIARGQGKSMSGSALEYVTLEAIMPGNIGVIVDCETDNRARTIQNLRSVIKKAGGAASPSNYLFEKRGRIVFEAKEDIDADQVLEAALDAGALDVDEDVDGNIIVFTEATAVKAVAVTISQALKLQVSNSELVYSPNEDTIVPMQSENAALEFAKLVDDMNEHDATVQGVYMNISQGSLEDSAWSDLQTKVNV